MADVINPMELLRRLQSQAPQMSQAVIPASGAQQAAPVQPATAGATSTPAVQTTQQIPSLGERIFSALQAPQATEGGRPQTSWEKWGTPDVGLGISSILGTLAQAVDPQGWGGGLGGAMAKMTQGEMGARNAAERGFEQQKTNRELLALYKALLGSQAGKTPTTAAR